MPDLNSKHFSSSSLSSIKYHHRQSKFLFQFLFSITNSIHMTSWEHFHAIIKIYCNSMPQVLHKSRSHTKVPNPLKEGILLFSNNHPPGQMEFTQCKLNFHKNSNTLQKQSMCVCTAQPHKAISEVNIPYVPRINDLQLLLSNQQPNISRFHHPVVSLIVNPNRLWTLTTNLDVLSVTQDSTKNPHMTLVIMLNEGPMHNPAWIIINRVSCQVILYG